MFRGETKRANDLQKRPFSRMCFLSGKILKLGETDGH